MAVHHESLPACTYSLMSTAAVCSAISSTLLLIMMYSVCPISVVLYKNTTGAKIISTAYAASSLVLV